MAYTILQVPGDGEVISGSFLTRIRDNQEFLFHRPGVGDHFQRFTSSGTWTKPAGITWVYAEIIGGGAGGYTTASSGIGGGPGWVTRQLILASTLSSSVQVTIGAGGVWLNQAGFDNSDGGHSSFGSYSARGGIGYGAYIPKDYFKFHPPGTGGSGGSSAASPRRGMPGIGQTAYTDGGASGVAPSDGADSLTGTGAGGGGYWWMVANSGPGNGGVPGGGGGSSRFTGTTVGGGGGRGEVRLWGW